MRWIRPFYALLSVGTLVFCSSPCTRAATNYVSAWGNNASGQTNVPPGLTNVVAIAAGYSHSLALKSDGTVVAWGNNDYGQTNTPPDLFSVVAIAGGWYHSLALKSDGTVASWGAGVTNSGSAPDFGQSIPPGNLTNAVAIAAGRYHSLALKADGMGRRCLRPGKRAARFEQCGGDCGG